MYRVTVSCNLALVLLLGGCVTSLQPLVTDENAIVDTNLIGTWKQTDGDSTWEFQSESQGYRVIITAEQGKRGEFHGRLTELDSRRYLDLKPDLDSLETLDFYKWHLLATHSFLRLDVTDDKMDLALMNIQWLQQYLEQHPDAIATQEIDDRHVLSAPTAELRVFVAAHAAEPEFFLDPIELERGK
jgi:hypothetical protein